jgi:hypothetical protein
MIAPEELRRLLRYEPDTGRLFWLERTPETWPEAQRSIIAGWNARHSGRQAGALKKNGYVGLGIFGKHYYAHRVILAMTQGEWPEMVDHINGVPSDNRLENLRPASYAINAGNRCLRSDNTSDTIGVHWDGARGKWAAEIQMDGQKLRLGRFAAKHEAIAARRAAESRLGFHPNHGRSAL